jgi:4-hydroxy-tetrahydrodipicolinate synthase
MIHPHGIIPAVPAIFDDTDQLLAEEVGNVISFLRRVRCEGIAMNLIGGEFYKLSEQERREMVRTGLEATGGGMPVYSGISAPGTTEACRMAKIATDIGVDCLIVMPPYYNPTGAYSRHAIIDHFSSIARCTDLPFIIQDFNYGIPLEILARLQKEFSNFVGLKIEGSRPVQIEKRIRTVRAELGREFRILGGMLGVNVRNEIASGSSGSIPGSSLADFISREYADAKKGSSESQTHHGTLEEILITESRRMKYFVYIEKEILKHRGIIGHTKCRKPYDYPSRKVMNMIMADVDSLVAR